MANKNPRVQILCLELIEYLTCTSTLPFYQEIHGREFLQMINFYINQASTNEVTFLFPISKILRSKSECLGRSNSGRCTSKEIQIYSQRSAKCTKKPSARV